MLQFASARERFGMQNAKGKIQNAECKRGVIRNSGMKIAPAFTSMASRTLSLEFCILHFESHHSPHGRLASPTWRSRAAPRD
jgi:hypothetical protein